MSLIDSILSKFAYHECLGCGTEGALLCTHCAQSLRPAVGRCYRCQLPSASGYTCQDCLNVSHLSRVQAAVAYQGAAKALLWKLKSAGAQSAAHEMIRHALASLDFPSPTGSKPYLVPVPTASSRARQRGYDQASLLTRQLSRQLHLPCRQYLSRRGQAHQVGANRQQRLQQIEHAFRVKRPGSFRGAHIILVDDVLTTGATLEVAAKALRQAGAYYIEAIVFAQA